MTTGGDPSAAGVEDVERALRDACGITLTEGLRTTLAEALRRAARATGLDPDTFRARLRARDARCVAELVEAAVVGETYFFRHPEQLEVVRQVVLERAPRERALRIWSAGCATGEEPYTLAMLLRDAGRAGCRDRILATDVSTRALAVAAEATYGPWSLRRLDPVARARHLVGELPVVRVREEVRVAVELRRHNLFSEPPPPGQFDLVVCRNVLIYFDPETARTIAARLLEAVAPGGFLLLGPVEVPLAERLEAERIDVGGTTLLRRMAEGERAAPKVERARPRKGSERSTSIHGPVTLSESDPDSDGSLEAGHPEPFNSAAFGRYAQDRLHDAASARSEVEGPDPDPDGDAHPGPRLRAARTPRGAGRSSSRSSSPAKSRSGTCARSRTCSRRWPRTRAATSPAAVDALRRALYLEPGLAMATRRSCRCTRGSGGRRGRARAAERARGRSTDSTTARRCAASRPSPRARCAARSASRGRPHGRRRRERRMKVLLVDDTRTLLSLIQVYLMGWQIQFVEAKDGTEGLARAREHRPALVISDVRMPGMDGFELCAAIRGEPRAAQDAGRAPHLARGRREPEEGQARRARPRSSRSPCRSRTSAARWAASSSCPRGGSVAPGREEALSRAPADARTALDAVASPEERRRVLDERARAIAPARETAVVATLPVIAFALGGERYGVPVEAVFQILDAATLSPLPATPAWLLGAAVSRGRVVPVVDLRQLLGLDGGGMSDLAKIVVVEHGPDAFGLAAEVVEGKLELPRGGLSPVTAGPFAWIAPDRLAVLDLAKLAAPAAHG